MFWYVNHLLMSDESVERNGFVLIVRFPSLLNHFDRLRTKYMITSWREVMPVKLRACHIFSVGVVLNYVLPIIMLFMSKHMRQRVRVHSGVNAQSILDLQSYGIGREELPQVIGGNFITDLDWARKRLLAEQQSDTSNASY